MVSTDTIPAHQIWGEHSRCAFDVGGGLLSRVYPTLRLGSPDRGAFHRVAGRIYIPLRYVCHCPALANFRGCAHLVAGSGLFHISRTVLRFLLNFSAPIVPFSLDLDGYRTRSFFPVAHCWLYLLHIRESRGENHGVGLEPTYR